MTTKKYFVFSGGGICGLAHIGAIKALTELDLFEPRECIGSSAGSIIATLITLGYSVPELIEIVETLNFKKYSHIEPFKLLTHFGFDSGKKLVKKFKRLIKFKMGTSNISFKDLYERTNIKLTITGSSLNTCDPIYFNHINTPDIMVYNAVRVSIGVPIYFTTVTYKGMACVDGGVFDNYPIHLMKNYNKDEVLGFQLVSNAHIDNFSGKINNIGTYTKRLLYCLLCEIEQLRNKDISFYDECSVLLDTKEFNSLDFKLPLESRKKLIEIGYKETIKFFEK